MRLLNLFTINKAKYLHLQFKSNEVNEFYQAFPRLMRLCYVGDEEIKKRDQSIPLKIFIDTFIPSRPNIQSGEFGEILTHHLLIEKYLPTIINGPKKWLWKSDKNHTPLHTDVVLYCCNPTPSKEDILVSAEVKTKAKYNPKTNPIGEAVKGAYKDSITRLAESLVYLKEKSIQKGDQKTVNEIERFQFSIEPEYGEFQTHFKAVAVIDESFANYEINKNVPLPTFTEDFEVLIVIMKDMDAIYKKIYSLINNSSI